jgi:hypothetical protein
VFRHVSRLDEPSVIEQICGNVKVADGYTCSNTEELLEAHRLLGYVSKFVVCT